jgi:hypothetical protein
MTAHAKLSASGSEKWMTCTPSANLEAQFPDEGSEFAREGTFAHELFEMEMNYILERLTGKEYNARRAALMKNAFYSQELEDYVQEAVDFAVGRIEQIKFDCKDPVIMVEQRLDFSRWVPEGFGTGDLVIVADGIVEVMDLKYGKGIYVDPIHNSQLRLYGLGAINELRHLYDLFRVRMTVLQPRLHNYGTEEIQAEDLLEWAIYTVKPLADLAWVGKGEFVAGEHCTSSFCKARYTCPARAAQAVAIAQQEFGPLEDAQPPLPESLSMDRIAELLPKADMVIDWFNDLKAYAFKQATEHNTMVPGYKLVEGRSNRKYSDQDAVAAKLVASGVPEEVIYERSLLGITAMEKAVGKKVFAEVLDGLIVKPEGKPTLVQVSDKRPALASAASAVEDFNQ